jgi:hypothetical protein
VPTGPQSRDGILSAETVADAVIEGLDREAFLILSHKEVAGYMKFKADDYDRWIRGMNKLQISSRERAQAQAGQQ